MLEEVDHAIARLRQAVSAKTDAELAARLNVDQSTVSAWRARGRVPDKYLKKYAGADNRSPILSAPKGLDEIESRSHSIALVRFLILRRDEIDSKSINPTMSLFMDMLPFWLIMYRSVSDVRVKMGLLNVDPATAQALVLQEDLRDPPATLLKVRSELAEDMADNPWLADSK